ncbi:MAG: hypothetical protein US52_C0051G0007 [candidate division WS6 bacterium GW2011_GWA2_37_6]|uniref:Uncharacterized protein n=1 Tax=candidate division WS6 bacterium GW2011_GWA2_37_6 TaxID=1619087 RepID=A0A0G0H819_9BACT|nr:MAG: hypothetical protein US52_C0051G0007 [candidate division WS6 bacterium GW2011_GWA2_37_6]
MIANNTENYCSDCPLMRDGVCTNIEGKLDGLNGDKKRTVFSFANRERLERLYFHVFGSGVGEHMQDTIAPGILQKIICDCPPKAPIDASLTTLVEVAGIYLKGQRN